MTSDSIADMLTRIRNANQAHHRTVEIPVSKMKVEIARVLTEEGFVDGYEVSGEAPMQVLTVTLKPGSPRGRALSGLRRISRPGLRVYARKSEIPRVLGGLGVAIISTSRGLMTGRAAQRAGLGGEVVAFVWGGFPDVAHRQAPDPRPPRGGGRPRDRQSPERHRPARHSPAHLRAIDAHQGRRRDHHRRPSFRRAPPSLPARAHPNPGGEHGPRG